MVFSYYTVIAFINFVTSLIFGIFVISKNRRSQKNISFFIFSIYIALWSLFYFFWQNVTNSAEWALFWCRALEAPCVLIPAGYLHFSLAMTETIKKRKKILFFAYAVFIAFFISDFTPYMINKVGPIMDFKYWPMTTVLDSAWDVCFLICILYCFWVLIKGYRDSTGIRKLQLKYIAIGTIISFIGGSFNILPFYGIKIPPVAYGLLPVYIFLMVYAITRYRLMDIRVAIRNLIFYFGFSFSLYIIFYIIAGTYKFYFGDVFAMGGYFLGLFLTPLLGIIMYAGGGALSNFINKYLFTSLYNYQQVIENTSQKLNLYNDLDNIADTIMEAIKKILNPKNIALLLVNDENAEANKSNAKYFIGIKITGFNDKSFSMEKDLFSRYFEKKQEILIKDELSELIENTPDENNKNALVSLKNELEKYNIVVCAPLINKNLLSGVIIIGDSLNKDSYTKEDFIFLETLSHQAQTAIENNSLYRKIEEKNVYLQELLNEKNDFVRIISHQLNTPLSIMKNAQNMVKNGSFNLKQGMYYFENGLNRMDEVLKDFWNVSQSESKIKTTPERTDIVKFAEKAKSMIKKDALSADKKDIKIITEKNTGDIPDVWCDPKQISQALYNLLNNAVTYTSKGKISVSYEITKNNNFLKVSIKDTGIGFSKEDKKKIGEKFYRSKKAVLARPDGSGIGIYICKKLVENNDGELSFESDGENKGSTFSISLPIYKGQT